MKIKIVALALIAFIGVNAQEKSTGEKPKDKIVETETRIINVMENGKMVQKKVMVRTTQEQTVKTDPSYEGTIDAPRVFPKTKVSKVIYIDNDNDPFYDKESDISYYKQDGMSYNFNPTNAGFEIVNAKTNTKMGTARFSNNAEVYLLDTEEYTGIGYFRNGQFVIEYYDDKGTLVVERFDDKKM